MFIVDKQTCRYCGAEYSIISEHHPMSLRFPWSEFCSDKCKSASGPTPLAPDRAGSNDNDDSSNTRAAGEASR